MGTEKHKLKKIAIYGDSISTTSHGNGGYEEALKTGLQLDQLYNFAVSASGLATDTPHNMVELITRPQNIPSDVALMLIWHGSNDWYWGTEMGYQGSKACHTFWGGIDFVVNQLREKNPFAKIVWVTPIYRHEAPHQGAHRADAYHTPNATGHTLLDYYLAIKEASERYGFSVIDLHTRCQIHQYNEHCYLEDHVHPNAKGYELLSEVLLQEIRKLWGH